MRLRDLTRIHGIGTEEMKEKMNEKRRNREEKKKEEGMKGEKTRGLAEIDMNPPELNKK